MAAALEASILDVLQGLKFLPASQGATHRCSLEGVTFGPTPDGAFGFAVRKLEAVSLRLACGPFTLEVATLTLHELAGQVRLGDGSAQLGALDAAGGELAGVKIGGPLHLPQPAHGPAATGPWSLGPLAAADGMIRAEIVDAHLLFDADVKVPIRRGRIDFGDATVEHVGPDSRMGASRLGIYVDAPNGRSYLYQFSSPPVAGVQYERRGALLGPWVTDRGSLQLQPFGEWLLREALGGKGLGVTEQARLLFDRTAVSGEVQLGDARFAAPGVQADLVGRADRRNLVRIRSEAVGRGLTVEIAALAVRQATLAWNGMQLGCQEGAGALTLQVSVKGAELRFTFELASLTLSGLHLRP